MLEVLYHRAKFGRARISPAVGTAENVEFLVCLFVRHAFERQRPIFGRLLHVKFHPMGATVRVQDPKN